jgi:hypothetical protein
MDRIKKEHFVYLNIITSKKQKVIAICDEDILGKTYREGKLKLEISEEFYKGFRVSLNEAINYVSDADIANLSGKIIVNSVVKKGLANPNAIIAVSGVPHLQILKL